MGGKKNPKNVESKSRQLTSSPVKETQITENKFEEKSTNPADIGNKKLQLQREREEREAREEKERKRAAEEKAKQEAKSNSTKKKSKKTSPRAQNVGEPKPEFKPPKLNTEENVTEPKVQIQRNTSGNWNIGSQSQFNKEPESDNQGHADDPETDWGNETANSNQGYINPDSDNSESTTKKGWGKRKNSYQSPDFAWDGLPSQSDNTSNSEQKSQPSFYGNKNNSYDSSYQRRSYNNDGNNPQDRNYSRGDTNYNRNSAKSRTSEPTYRQDKQFENKGSRLSEPFKRQDNFGQFSNKGSNYNWGGSWQNHKYDGRNDPAFQKFLDLSKQRPAINHGKLTEIKGDLFTASEEYSLAHCVAEDMSMGAGIAKTFRTLFGDVGFLLNQREETGGLAVLEKGERYIYYLVTKEQSRGKPTMYTLWLSVQRLKQHIQENNVTKLAIPQIGCGLDRLDWRTVKQMLEYVFKDIDIDIVVYIWDENVEEKPTAPQTKLLRKCAVVHVQMKLTDIDKGTGLVYFGSVDGHQTEEFKVLADKFNISAGYRAAKTFTEVIKIIDKNEYIYGLINKKSFKDPIDYVDTEKTLKNLSKMLKKDKTIYIGFQAFHDEKEKFVVDKIISLMQYTLLDIEIWVCWPDELKEFCPQQNKSY